MNNKSLFKLPDGRNMAFTFFLITSLFLLWGFCNGLIDVLNKHFQNSLHVTKTESALVQFANYMGYFLMAIPAGIVAKRFGYKVGIILGLVLIAVGAFWFIPATFIGTYWAFLTGLFILASGLTFLETIANPYTTVLGPKETGAARINLAQSCNGVGWILGPLVGGHFIFAHSGEAATANDRLYLPYLGVGVVVTILAVIFLFANVPDLQGESDEEVSAATGSTARSLWSHPHFVFAVVAQFLYVAAQTGIFSFFINYVVSETPHYSESLAKMVPTSWSSPEGNYYKVTELGASQLLAFGGFGLFLLGRFIGSLLVRQFKPHLVLGGFALANIAMMLLVILPLGWISWGALFASFFFLSIMFPTIFALGIHGLGEHTKQAASLIVMAIVGGAVMPLLMGWLADKYSMSVGFFMPLGCFVVVAIYGLMWARLSHSKEAAIVGTAAGH